MKNQRYYEVSLLLIRLTLGVTFLIHGTQKIMGFDGLVKYFAASGLPPFLPYMVTAIETGAGVCLLLGLFTRLAGLGVSTIMLGAMFTVKSQAGFVGGYEYDVMILAAALSLVLSGSHLIALDSILLRRFCQQEHQE